MMGAYASQSGEWLETSHTKRPGRARCHELDPAGAPQLRQTAHPFGDAAHDRVGAAIVRASRISSERREHEGSQQVPTQIPLRTVRVVALRSV